MNAPSRNLSVADTPKPRPVPVKTPCGLGDKSIKGFCKTLKQLWAKMDDEPSPEWFSVLAVGACGLVLLGAWCA